MEVVMNRSTLWTDRGLLLLRIGLGIVFVMHGWQKLFVFGHAGVTGALASLGIPFAPVNAVLITAVELGGGIALLAGAATRVAAAFVGFAMLVAVATAHLAHGFFAPAGIEYPLTLMLANLALVMTGAGRYSLDARLFGRSRVYADEELKLAA
jgi:putative oxidoreductase